MGVTIRSKNMSADMGYGGFNRFRTFVAKAASDEFYEHYKKLDDPNVMMLSGQARDAYFKKYDKESLRMLNEKVISLAVARLCLQPDCEGTLTKTQSRKIYELIKDANDDISYGYSGRSDCAKMKDLKEIFLDGSNSPKGIKWI